MPTYAIGDIQGCYVALQRLLEVIHFDPHTDTLWCTGDLVNRGPHSLEVLRFFKGLGEQHQIVLGNHDLHLIAVSYGVRKLQQGDTLRAVLEAAERDDLIDWLCHRPLFVQDVALGFVMTHAGLAPAWDVKQAQMIAAEVEAVLRGNLRESFLKEMYGNAPAQWNNYLSGMERLRCAVNYFTRMRYCYPDGSLNLTYKGDLQHKPAELLPWFEVSPHANINMKIIFGHWAALNGKTGLPNIFALDTGCVWGNTLTAMRLEDEARFSVPCK